MEAGVAVLPCVDVSNCLHATKFVCDITNYVTMHAMVFLHAMGMWLIAKPCSVGVVYMPIVKFT